MGLAVWLDGLIFFGQNKPFRFELLAIVFIIMLKFQLLINSNLQLLAF